MSPDVEYGRLRISFPAEEEVEFQLPIETPFDKDLPPGEEWRGFLPTLEDLAFQAAIRRAGGQVLSVTVDTEKITTPIVTIPLLGGKKLDLFHIPVFQRTTFGYRLCFPSDTE